MSRRVIVRAVDVAVSVGVLVGAARGVSEVLANGYLGIGFHRLAALAFRDAIHHGLLVFGAGTLVAFVVWAVLALHSKRTAARGTTFFVVAVIVGLVGDRVLARFTRYDLRSALESLWTRLGDLVSGEIGVRAWLGLVRKHADAVVWIAAGVAVLFGLCWLLGRFDLRPLYRVRGWMRKPGFVVVAVSWVVWIGMNAGLWIDGRAHRPTGPNIVLVCIDALRADALGTYGYERNTSPFLDRLAADGVLFRNARSQSSWTKTSVASYLTSTFGVLGSVATKPDKLDRNRTTVAEVLRNRGYRTAAVVANPWLEKTFGLSQGFEHYNEGAIETQRIEVHDVLDAIPQDPDVPFFLYLHFMDVHNPYDPPAPYDTLFAGSGNYFYRNGRVDSLSMDDLEYTRGLYDGEIRFVDEKVRKVIEFLDRARRLEQTAIVVISDHGEEFLEHGGMGHGTTLYRELLHVPLIVRLPGRKAAGTVVETPVRSLDIVPTLLDLAAVSPPASVQGASLLPLLDGGEPPERLTIAAVTSIATGDRLLCVVEREHKFVRNATKGTVELYDTAADPRERDNLADSLAVTATELERQLESYTAALLDRASGDKTQIDQKLIDRLKSLGYL